MARGPGHRTKEAECLWFPFGTILGVFTLIVLMRPAVKAQFLQASRDPFG
ncbi:MAG: hypothetical protein KF708_00870 [Pirellulales bacterium]|nr:hypothetical protein [Pirellulales bacterium]